MNGKKNKVALVIGGNSGIGSACTKQLMDDGFFVCSTYFNNQDKLENLTKDKQYSNKLSLHHLDVCNGDNTIEVISKIKNEFDSIDVVLISVAPELKNKQIFDLRWEDYNHHIELQIKPIHFSVKALEDQIRAEAKAKFIVILTEYCFSKPPKRLADYVTSKYSALGISKVMATELAQFGSTVNMVSPGMVDTSLLKNIPAKLIEITAYENPLKRIACVEDVSSVVSFLASEKSDYLNGVNITVNGGGVLI